MNDDLSCLTEFLYKFSFFEFSFMLSRNLLELLIKSIVPSSVHVFYRVNFIIQLVNVIGIFFICLRQASLLIHTLTLHRIEPVV